MQSAVRGEWCLCSESNQSGRFEAYLHVGKNLHLVQEIHHNIISSAPFQQPQYPYPCSKPLERPSAPSNMLPRNLGYADSGLQTSPHLIQSLRVISALQQSPEPSCLNLQTKWSSLSKRVQFRYKITNNRGGGRMNKSYGSPQLQICTKKKRTRADLEFRGSFRY